MAGWACQVGWWIVLLRLPYLAVSSVFAFIRLLSMRDVDKDIEILTLRHQLGGLQRQIDRPRHRADRVFLAGLLHRLPKPKLRQLHLIVSPETVRASRRAFSASRLSISLSLGFAFGLLAGAASASRAPLSRCRRHVVISDEYGPSCRRVRRRADGLGLCAGRSAGRPALVGVAGAVGSPAELRCSGPLVRRAAVENEVEEALGLLALFGLSRGQGDAREGEEHVGRADVRPDGAGGGPGVQE